MKSYLSLTCGVLLIGALIVLSSSQSDVDSSSSSASKEEIALIFPEYPINPENLPDDSRPDVSIGASNENESEHPEQRTFFLILRLLQLLSQSNSTIFG